MMRGGTTVGKSPGKRDEKARGGILGNAFLAAWPEDGRDEMEGRGRGSGMGKSE